MNSKRERNLIRGTPGFLQRLPHLFSLQVLRLKVTLKNMLPCWQTVLQHVTVLVAWQAHHTRPPVHSTYFNTATVIFLGFLHVGHKMRLTGDALLERWHARVYRGNHLHPGTATDFARN